MSSLQERVRQAIDEAEARESRIRDRKMILDYSLWPKWPILPLKRRSGNLMDDGYVGFLLAVEAPPYRVYNDFIYALKPGGSLADAVAGMKYEDYAELETLLDTWTVD